MTGDVTQKNRGDRAERLSTQVLPNLFLMPLTTAIMASDPFDLTIFDTRVCAHHGVSLNLHSNGDENSFGVFSTFIHGLNIWTC